MSEGGNDMEQQKQFTQEGPVLDKHGSPYPGYSTRSIRNYERKAIKASAFRIKEWDFYQITNRNLCLQFTIGHSAYAGQVGAMLFDFEKGERLAEIGQLLVLPMGSLHLPEDAEKNHVVEYIKKQGEMKFTVEGNQRHLTCKWGAFVADILLKRQNNNSLVINIPFDESPKAFYYNHKINCMTAEGIVNYQGVEYRFDPKDSFGLLDWGRGVWPFHNEWYWSNATDYLGDKIFGFNLGCGFGNTKEATENILFYGDTTHKLGEVKFELDRTNYMKPWRIYDLDGRLDLTLTPTYDRTTVSKLLWIDNCCHQMFGTFSGKVVLDDNTELKVENIISFAEHAINNW